MDSTDTADRTAQQPDENESRSATSATNVALIRSSVDARWMGLAYDSERRLAQGKTVTLRAGLAEIVFEDGATVIIQGPITFEPTGPNAMRLDTGRIVATVPPAAIGFTIDTPTARIIDYGTEFGVHVDGHASTRVHVFQGEVRAAARVRGVLAEPVRLVEQQAAVIDTGGASIARAAFDAESFERHVVKRLDLVDIIAGGDGTTGRRNRGLDCTTGAVVSRDQLPVTAAQHRLETRGRYLAVPDLEFVDGVFAPRRGWAQVQVSSEGHTFGRFDEATEITFGHLWAGDEVPIPSDYKHDGQLLRMPEAARRGMNEVFGAAGFSGVDDRILLMHAPKGITFDLAAIRLAHEGMQTRRFRSRVVYAGDQMPDYGTGDTTQYPTGADVWVLVDGEVRGVVRDITAEHGPVEIDVELTEDDRYLTLVTTSGSDQVQTFDWLLFGAPEIELAPPPEAD